jgi:hypothetical protein
MSGTIYIPFTPTQTGGFSVQLTLDGNPYNVSALWNFYRQDWYLNIQDLSQNPIACLPAVESPNNYNISITAGYFTTSIVRRYSTGNLEISG